MTPATRSTLFLPFAGAAALALYWSGLNGPFLFDDAFNLSPVFRWYHDAAGWIETLFGNVSGLFGRPVSMLSFLLTASFGIEPFHFKVGNVLLHALTAVVGGALLRTLLALDPRLAPNARWLAWTVAALWLVHPLNVSTVLYAVQRMAQLSTLFTLLAVLVYVRARLHLIAPDRDRALKGLFLLFPAVVGLGVLSKENAAVAPALCFLVELAFFWPRYRWPAPVKAFFAAFLALPACLAAGALLANPDRLLGGYVARDFSLGERLLTQARALQDYASLLILPSQERMGLYTDGYPLSTGLLEPPATLLAFVLLAAMSIAAVALRRRAPAVFFGWFFFLVAHAIESSIFPLDLYYEHRNYLPAWGFLLLPVAALSYLFSRNLKPELGGRFKAGPVAWALTSVVLLAFAWATHQRVQVWRDFETLLAHALTTQPDSTRAKLAAARHYASSGRGEEAIHALSRLDASTDPRDRLLGLIETASTKCVLGLAGADSDLRAATSLAQPRLTIDEVQVVGYLMTRSRPGACSGLDDHTTGPFLAGLADAATAQADGVYAKQQIRYAAALSFARSKQWQDALTQAQHAWQPGATIEVGALLVDTQVKNGKYTAAERTIEEMAARVSNFDATGHRLIAGVRMMLRPAVDAAGREPDASSSDNPAESHDQ